ncbi:MAG: hypothetical protein RIF46_02975 [Cyclobacteriaceae bacterium]
MKILLINLLMTLSLGTEANSTNEDFTLMAQDNAMEEINLMITEQVAEKVKIMDANGNVVREISKTDYNTNNMEANDYKMLSSSSHMFDYLGDAYYLLEE